MGVYVDTHEVDHLAFDLGAAPGRVGAKVSAAIKKTAHDIEADAKILVPVDTGFLKNSISTDIENNGRFGQMFAEIGPTAGYGGYVEEGTSRQSPQPYLRPAFDRRKEGLVKALEDIIGDFL